MSGDGVREFGGTTIDGEELGVIALVLNGDRLDVIALE